MKLMAGSDGLLFLEHLGRNVRVDRKDWLFLSRMTPMGRKVYFGRKGKLMLLEGKQVPDAELLISWSRLPAREWDFVCLPR